MRGCCDEGELVIYCPPQHYPLVHCLDQISLIKPLLLPHYQYFIQFLFTCVVFWQVDSRHSLMAILRLFQQTQMINVANSLPPALAPKQHTKVKRQT